MHILRVALRLQVRYPWFTLTSVLSLSLGIICSSIIFLYVFSHLRTDTFHDDAYRIYRVVLQIKTAGGEIEYEPGTPLPLHKVLPEEFSHVEIAAFCMRFYNAATVTIRYNGREDRYKEENIVAYADDNFVEMFSHQFVAGNGETALAEPGSVAVSEDLAVKYFGSRADALGQVINLNNMADVRITGIFASPTHDSDMHFKMLVSLPTLKTMQPGYQEDNFTWVGSNNWTFIKLVDKASSEEVQDLLAGFREKYLGPDFAHWHFQLQPLSDMHYDVRYDGVVKRSVLWILSGVTIMLLLVISANYVNLTVAKAHFRAKEIGIRKYLGESRRQLFMNFMLETGLLVIVSFLLAGVVIIVVLPVVNEWLQSNMRLSDLIYGGNLLYVLAFAFLLTFMAGYYPAIHLSGFNPLKAIAGRMTNITSKQVAGKMLFTFQYAVALFFLISTIVIVGQANYMLGSDLGFTGENVINVRVPRGDHNRIQTFRDEIAGFPGVEVASLHNQPPMSLSKDGGFIRFDGRQKMEDFMVRERWGDEHFLDTYSIELIAGRNYRVKGDTLREVLVNETMLRKLQISDPEAILGKPIFIDNSATHGTIVGVVRDFHHQSMRSEIEPLVINPMKEIFNQIGIRIQAQAFNRTVDQVKGSYMALFPNDIFEFSFLDDTVRRIYRIEEITGKLMRVFSIVAVIISLIGILGLSSLSNLKRMKEIAIRKVLGATVADILTLLCKEYLILLVASFSIAIPAAYLFVDRWLNTFAYRIELNWLLFIVPGLALILVTISFVGLQSLRTSVVNASQSIRNE